MPTYKPVSVAKLISGGTLPRLLDHSRALAQLDQALRKALPEPLNEHCHVINLRGQTLTLAADSPAWATRLRYQSRTVLQHLTRLQSVTVRTIQVRIAPEQPTKQKKPKRHAHLSATNAQLLQQTANSLSDPRLRAALLKVASRGGKAKEST